MCILFSYIAKRITPGEFKLIILNNRDEYHHRASQPAKFVNENNVYGVDLTPNKEGGTWLGCNRFGKIAALLNLDKEEHGLDDPTKEGRGFLVPNFLNGRESSESYVESIKSKADAYNPFNLLLFERNSNDLWRVGVFDNIGVDFKIVDNEFVSISNHQYHRPHRFAKTIVGQDLFDKIVTKYKNTSMKAELMNQLSAFAKYDAGKKFDNLPNKDQRSLNEMMREQVFINIPNYGTRTHTIILVDDNNTVTYHEKTMQFPIEAENPVWIEETFEFDLKTSS